MTSPSVFFLLLTSDITESNHDLAGTGALGFGVWDRGLGAGGWSLGLDGEETTDAGWYNVALQGPPALTGRMRAEASRSKLNQN